MPSRAVLLMVIAVIISLISIIQAQVTLVPSGAQSDGAFYDNTPMFFSATTTDSLEPGNQVKFTSTDVFAEKGQCLFFTEPTPFDLLRDPADSYHEIGNCFPAGDSINGNDAVASLVQPRDDIDCTATDAKPLLIFTAIKAISSGTKLRCLGRTTSAIGATADRTITFTGSSPALDAITIKPNLPTVKITNSFEYSKVGTSRVVLLSLDITPAAAVSTAQVLPLSAAPQYKDASGQDVSQVGINALFNHATAGAYRTIDDTNNFTDQWSHLCGSTTGTKITPGTAAPTTPDARLFVGEHQPQPLHSSNIPRVYKTQWGSQQTNLLVKSNASVFKCIFPVVLPSPPTDAVIGAYTPITVTVGDSTAQYSIPYTNYNAIEPVPTNLNQPISAPFFESYTTVNVPSNNASVSYIFNLYINYPLFAPGYYEQSPAPPAPTFKYIIKPTATYGENTSLEKALGLVFPDGSSNVIWSILTPTTEYSTLTWDPTAKQFVVEFVGTVAPTRRDHLQVQARFQTVAFSPPINAGSEQTSFDVVFNAYDFTNPTGPQLNDEDLLYRIRPTFLIHDFAPISRRNFGAIRFTLQLRAVGFPGAQYGQWQENAPAKSQPVLKCWMEMTDDLTPPEGGTKSRIHFTHSVSGQQKSAYRVGGVNQKYQDYILSDFEDNYDYVYGGKLQLTTLQVTIPVSLFGKFPYRISLLKIGCGFDGMQPVVADYNIYSDATNKIFNSARLAFDMDELSSYLDSYQSQTSFSARASALMLRVTSDKEIQSQYDLEILESAAFSALKDGVSTDPLTDRAWETLSFFDLRYYVPRTSSTDLESQSVMLASKIRIAPPTQEELLLLPLTQAFSHAPRIHISKSTSATTTGLDDAAVYTAATAQDTRKQTGSVFHWLIRPDFLDRFASNSPAQIRALVDSYTFPSTGLDWNKNRFRLELIAYDPDADADKLGGFPYQPNCDVMFTVGKFAHVGYQYPGYNPTCAGRPVGQQCAHHNQCNGGFCDPTSYTCVRSFASLPVLNNPSSVDPLKAILATPPMSNAFQSMIGAAFVVALLNIVFVLV